MVSKLRPRYVAIEMHCPIFFESFALIGVFKTAQNLIIKRNFLMHESQGIMHISTSTPLFHSSNDLFYTKQWEGGRNVHDILFPPSNYALQLKFCGV